MKIGLMSQLVSLVQKEFGVSRAEVITALHHEEAASQFPMILWQYGFITIQQLDDLFDWLERERLRFTDG